MSLWIHNTSEETKTYFGRPISPDAFFHIEDHLRNSFKNDVNLLKDILDGVTKVSVDGVTDLTTEPLKQMNALVGLPWEPEKTSDGLDIFAVNRILSGYSLYIVGRSDNIDAGTFGDGDVIELTKQKNVVDFQLLRHWFACGATAIFEGCSRLDKVSSYLYAPATQGLIPREGGEYIIAGGVLIIYVGEGAGTHDLDLDATVNNNGDVLMCVPVPAAGNTGFFDYDKFSNVIQPNIDQQGGYNLYTIDIDLHSFGNCLHGRKQDGQQAIFQSTDVVGKLLYNCWKIRFELTAGSEDPWIGIEMTTFCKGNV